MPPRLPQPADTDGVRLAVDDGVVTVTLCNAPRKNAITNPMWGEIEEGFTWIASDDALRAVVVTGEGEEFCSGADLGELPEVHWLAWMRRIADCCLAVAQVPQPTIARIDGIAAGAGLNLALACDLVVASERARFSEIFSRRGLSLDFGGSWFLPRRVGLAKAKELALLAPIIDAAEAERIGLVNKVVAVADLDGSVDDWARQLAGGPPIALAQTKALLDASATSTLAESLAAEGSAQTVNLSTDDTREAIAAFMQKRTPVYRGS